MSGCILLRALNLAIHIHEVDSVQLGPLRAETEAARASLEIAFPEASRLIDDIIRNLDDLRIWGTGARLSSALVECDGAGTSRIDKGLVAPVGNFERRDGGEETCECQSRTRATSTRTCHERRSVVRLLWGRNTSNKLCQGR